MREVGIYVRVSRKGDREDERFHSPREQAERASALTLARGFTPGPVFEDIDVSGATPPDKRPAMLDLLGRIDSGDLGGLAAYSLDRLSREPAHGDALVKRVTKAGGVILTPDIPDAIDSPTGEFTFGMLLQVAKLYRSQAGARFESAKERSIRAGIPVGRVPVGYRLRPDRRLEVDRETAPVVRTLFERWAARDGGRSTLSDLLSEATGRTWSREAVPKIIKNRLYATGRMEYGDIVSDWDAGAIVDEALWQAAQRAPAGRRSPRDPDSRWLLTGLLRCGSCGYSLTPSTTAGGRYRNYRCAHRACAARVSVAANRIEGFVLGRSMEVSDLLSTRAEAPDLAAFEEAAAVAEKRLSQVLAPEARDALGDLWAADAKARRLERDEALAALGEARQVAGTEAVEFRLRDVWDDLSPSDRRSALGLYWRAIRVFRRGEDGVQRVVLVRSSTRTEVEVALPEKPKGPE